MIPFGLTMMAGLVVKEIPFLFLVSLAAMGQVRVADHGRMATSLGYGRMAGFLFGSWPLIYRQTRLAVFAVIAYASSVVDVALILGPDQSGTACRSSGGMVERSRSDLALSGLSRARSSSLP